MNFPWWVAILWILGASLLGFLISAIFAGRMKCSRNLYLIYYIFVGSMFLAAFFRLGEIDVAASLSKNWFWGVLLGMLASVFLVRHVLSQPATRQHAGLTLVYDIAWPGLVYGLMDALLLNVMPVLAIWAGFSQFAWADTLAGRFGLGALGMVASLLVTLTYHLGYPEFRNRKVVKVLVGNSIMTLAFILSGNPLGALISHPAMHVAAVLRGPETTIQLPPHYQQLDN
jgi:hypothetical protein